MSRKELLDWINVMEQKYPVHKWMVNGMHVWPRIRVLFLFHLIEKNNYRTKSLNNADNKPLSKLNKTANYLNSFVVNIYYLLKLSQVDFAFLGAFSHRVKYKNSWFNRFFEPVIEDLEQDGYSCTRLEYGINNTDLESLPLYQQSKIIFVEKLIRPFRVYQKILKALGIHHKLELNYYDEFIGEVRQIPELAELEKTLNKHSLEYSFQKMAVYRSFFFFYLRIIRPKALFVLCYYSPAVYAAIAAARCIGIPTVDLQHGPQTGVHPAYSKFFRVPESGFNILPNIFWVWDQVSKEGLKEWIDRQEYHKVCCWGHPWVEYWLKQGTESTKNVRPVILYSLQPIGDLIEDYIIEAIKASWKDYSWCLRLHPRQQSQLSALRNRVEAAGLLDKIMIDDGLSNALPQVLAQTSLHLTRFSGTALEAAMFRVPTIFLDSVARDAFNDLIDAGKALMLESHNAESLLKCIKMAIIQQLNDEEHAMSENYHNLFTVYLTQT